MEKLQELCLDKIAASFEIYYHAYSKSPNEALKKGILFLQKVYSDKLILRLYKKGLMQEKYVHLVFTKYLKALNTEWLANCSWRTIVETFARIGPSLEEVCFDEDEFYRKEAQWKDIICHLPRLKKVIYKRYCDDCFLEGLARYCPELETLDVQNSYDNVTDVGLAYFCQVKEGKKRMGNEKCSDEENKWNVPCPLLKEIVLHDTSATNEGVERLLKEVPSLEKIGYCDLPVVLHKTHKENTESSDKIAGYKIAHLDMEILSRSYFFYPRTEPYDEIFKSCVAMCPNLTSAICVIRKLEDLNLCSTLKFLKKLELDCIAHTYIEVNDFLRQTGSQLTDLTLRRCDVSFSVLRQYCCHLEELTLQSLNIEYDGVGDDDSKLLFPYLENFRFENIDFFYLGNCRAISCILTTSPILENLYVRLRKPGKKTCITTEVETSILKRCEMPAFKTITFEEFVDVAFLSDVLFTCSPMKTVYLIRVYELQYIRRLAATIRNRPKILFTKVACFAFQNDFEEL